MSNINGKIDDSDEEAFVGTPPEVSEIAKTASLNLLPSKSRKQYEITYNRFKQWCFDKKVVNFTEIDIKPSSLWSEYSMVRSCLSSKENIDIKTYKKLMAFMKQNSVGFRPKKSKVFNREHIYKFLKEAPESQYLMKKESCSPKACQRDGDNPKPMCGSDGLSYPNRCVFERARCQNKNLTVGKRGACKKQRPCSEWSTFNQQNPMYNNSFIPKCRPDNSYDSAQCHLGANFCWCVTPEGVPLPYTISRRKNDNKVPKCGRKKSNRRRSSPANRRQQRNRICKRPEKSMMNNNLISSFHTEFTRDSGRNDTDDVVITWKFRMLDQNSDLILDKFEYRDLRRIVRKLVKPRKCAKQFPRSCDTNKDGNISLQEWDDCLTREGRMDMDDGRSQNTSNDSDGEDDIADYEDPFGPGKSTPHEVLSSALGPEGRFDEDSSEAAEDPTDCLSDRKTALSEGYQLYVPDCTPDGRYQKAQCYKSAGYCWCVNEDTGKNIPGTSVKNATPNCDHLKTNTRIMKGCPDDKKFIFLKELLHFLHTKMLEITNGTNTSSFNNLAWIASKEEQVATWSFVIFDKNKSKMLERNEWKAFKDMVGAVKGLRKCGKKLPRYCDINKDRQISMTEWLECLSISEGVSIPSFSSSPRAGKTNPLSMLKDD